MSYCDAAWLESLRVPNTMQVPTRKIHGPKLQPWNVIVRVLNHAEACMLGRFDLLFIAMELEDVDADVHSRKIDVDMEFMITTGSEVCNGNEIDSCGILKPI